MNGKPPIDRRTFLTTAGRYSAAAALLSGMGLLVLNNRDDRNCARPNPCGNCSLFTGCTLDRAEEARRVARQQQQQQATSGANRA